VFGFNVNIANLILWLFVLAFISFKNRAKKLLIGSISKLKSIKNNNELFS
tara:strand:+ start:95 stop:244 length:150 start_codon:yes stop_codon:yes gene_type:complete